MLNYYSQFVLLSATELDIFHKDKNKLLKFSEIELNMVERCMLRW